MQHSRRRVTNCFGIVGKEISDSAKKNEFLFLRKRNAGICPEAMSRNHCEQCRKAFVLEQGTGDGFDKPFEMAERHP
jgi:hypothetical protein